MQKMFLSTLLIIFFMPINSMATELAIFYPSQVSVSKRDKFFKKYLPETSIDTFAKYRDFRTILSSKKPDYVISNDIFGNYHKEYVRVLSFKELNQKSTQLILLAKNKKWNIANIMESKLGVVSTSSKKNQREYLTKIFNSKFKKIKTVSKSEDLFPLLVFEAVDVIAIEPNIYEMLKNKFNTKVHIIKRSIKFNTPSLYKRTDVQNQKIIKKIKNIENLNEIKFSGVN